MIYRSQTEFDLYLRLELTGFLRCCDVYQGDWHRHGFWELIYIVSGQATVTTSDGEVVLHADEGILVRPMEDHIYRTLEKDTSMFYLGFRNDASPSSFDNSEYYDPLIFQKLPSRTFLTNILMSLAKDLERASTSCSKTLISEKGPQLLEGLIPLSQWMQSNTHLSTPLPHNQQDMLCVKTIKYIRLNMNRFVSVDEIASSLYVSPHYLGMVFTNNMGQTVLKYQQQVKMEQAAKLIRGGMLSIAEIADELGYSSPQYFSKCFKNYYGFSPRQMKNKPV